MTAAQKAELKKLSPEKLIEGFVTEAKLEDLSMQDGREKDMHEHGDRSKAFIAEIAARGGLASLAPLLDSPDHWIAYRVGAKLLRIEETSDRALATLDRLAEESYGSASSSADDARNMFRYGDPAGDPVELEKRLAEIRARNQ